MKRKLLWSTIVVLVVGAILILAMPFYGKVTRWTERDMRESKLRSWNRKVSKFIEAQDRMPRNMYEVAKQCEQFQYIKVTVPSDFDSFEKAELLRDPNYFKVVIEYGIVTHNSSWYIVELGSGRLYKPRLAIDDKGRLFKFKQIKGP